MSSTYIHTYDPEEVPDAPWWVSGEDEFFSDWGCARKGINIVLVPCGSKEEALVVATNARAHGIKHVRVRSEMPHVFRTISVLTKETAPRWFEPGAFVPLKEHKDARRRATVGKEARDA